jgi:putative DNA primase/helicase
MNDDIINLEEERRRKADAQHVVAEVVKDAGVLTQDGIAEIFAVRYEGKLRYCHHTGAWFEFDGTRWKLDERSRGLEFVRQTNHELSIGRKIKELKALRSVGMAKGVETFAKGDRRLAVTADYWDRDAFLLGTPGGTVDLRTGVLRPGDPSDGITKATAVAPSTHTDCPVWQCFLRDISGDDAAVERFLQQWCGYALTADTSEHAILFVHGPGGNGKTVFLNTLTGIMGEYATTAPSDIFTISIGDRHPTELAMLRGARLVAASETEQGKAWAEIRIKALTGGDEVSARFMRCDYFKFRPAFKLTIIGNHQPTLENVDAAVRRRFNVLPFTFCPDKPDHQLEEKLRDEWPEIFRWMIKGCLDWQKHGLSRPERMLAATEEYFSNQDLVGQWLATCCDVHPGNDLMRETTTELYRSWSSFAKQAGAKPDTEKNFVGKLENRRFENRTLKRFRTKRARGFEGISLKVWGEA